MTNDQNTMNEGEKHTGEKKLAVSLALGVTIVFAGAAFLLTMTNDDTTATSAPIVTVKEDAPVERPFTLESYYPTVDFQVMTQAEMESFVTDHELVLNDHELSALGKALAAITVEQTAGDEDKLREVTAAAIVNTSDNVIHDEYKELDRPELAVELYRAHIMVNAYEPGSADEGVGVAYVSLLEAHLAGDERAALKAQAQIMKAFMAG